MKWRHILLVSILTTGCGMTVGLRPAGEAAGPVAAEAISVRRGETVVAGVTVTTLPDGARVATPAIDRETPTDPPVADSSTETPATTVAQATPAGESPTTSVPGPTTTTGPEATTTTTSAPTTTIPAVPPSSTVSLPEFEDIGTVFSADDDFVTHDCDGGDVTIAGDAGTYTLEGVCRAVLVRGSFNTVFVDELGAIDLTGTLNAVVYGAGTPTVNDWDGDNIVTGG